MRSISKAVCTALAVLIASCATEANTPMPPVPPNIQALVDADRGDPCGRPLNGVRTFRSTPEDIRNRHHQGWVVLRVTVGTSGTVTHSEILASSPPGMFDAFAKHLQDTEIYPPRADECTMIRQVTMHGVQPMSPRQ